MFSLLGVYFGLLGDFFAQERNVDVHSENFHVTVKDTRRSFDMVLEWPGGMIC